MTKKKQVPVRQALKTSVRQLPVETAVGQSTLPTTAKRVFEKIVSRTSKLSNPSRESMRESVIVTLALPFYNFYYSVMQCYSDCFSAKKIVI